MACRSTQVHLHEVGALDSIIDIVGAVFALEWFNADRIVVSPLNVGGGMVRSAHGVFPVPAPATLALLKDAPVYSSGIQKELLTPTGALILTEYATEFGPIPPMTIETDGLRRRRSRAEGDAQRRSRAGRRGSARPGGRGAPAASMQVAVLECEIDDMNPQIFGVLMDKLYAAGALEVFYSAVQMKKNRPGTLMTIIARPEQREAMTEIVFRESTTIGIRHQELSRECLEREMVTVTTSVGPVRFKVAQPGRPGAERAARVRRSGETFRTARHPNQGRAGAGAQGVARTMKYFLTTAIDFVNSRPHLGTAYEKITADIIARYRRLAGYETHFLMGNDEHSQNVFRKAAEQGKDPLAYCDEMERVFRDVWKRLDLSFDDFIRTTDRRRHFPAVQKMAQACLDNGDIYEGSYEGWYCEGCEAFKPEKDLVDGACPIHKTTPQWIKEKNWFFRLSKYQQPLLKHYRDHPSFIEPEIRRNEILRLVESGLEDISMSRAGQSWGIPVPFDPTSVVYVWFDALINYAAAVGYGWDDDLFKKWWPASLHVVGKDITRFHCVIWPAMLMSARVALPAQVFGHGWVYFKGERMSKTMGNIVDPLDAADRFGPDPLRLYLAKEIPYGGDGDFTWERFEEKYNADLANNLGNLVNRVASMTERYQQGRVTADRRRRAGRRSRPTRWRRIASRWTCTRCTKARRRRFA